MLFSKINLCHIPAFLCSWLSPTRYHLPQFFHSLFIIFFFIILFFLSSLYLYWEEVRLLYPCYLHQFHHYLYLALILLIPLFFSRFFTPHLPRRESNLPYVFYTYDFFQNTIKNSSTEKCII